MSIGAFSLSLTVKDIKKHKSFTRSWDLMILVETSAKIG